MGFYSRCHESYSSARFCAEAPVRSAVPRRDSEPHMPTRLSGSQNIGHANLASPPPVCSWGNSMHIAWSAEWSDAGHGIFKHSHVSDLFLPWRGHPGRADEFAF